MKLLKNVIVLANYLCSCVKGFAQVAGDFHALMNQDSGWKEEKGLPRCSREAFEAVKAAILSRPVWVYPKNTVMFHLYVNAALGDSKDQGRLGAELWQEDKNGIHHLVGYSSQQLTASEKNYPALFAERQAAVYGLTCHKEILSLHGPQIVVQTQTMNPEWIATKNEQT
jgi:hypothetical protein